MTHPPTARQQFDAIIESVQREALAAALALGFECTSRQKLLPALKRELAFWKEEYCWELDGPVADFADYPKAWSRVVCIEVIRMLLEEILGIIDGAGLDSGLEAATKSRTSAASQLGSRSLDALSLVMRAIFMRRHMMELNNELSR